MKKLNSLLKKKSSTKKRVVRKKAAKKKVGAFNKMAMNYRLTNNDQRNVEQMWYKLSADKTKSRGEIIDEISKKLKINWFEISSYLKRNIPASQVGASDYSKRRKKEDSAYYGLKSKKKDVPAKKKSAPKKKVGALPKSPSLIAQYSNSIAQINAAQKTLDEIALRMKLRPHPQMKLQMKEAQAKLKKYIREQKTHARELKKLI
jgi:hypothetical protein